MRCARCHAELPLGSVACPADGGQALMSVAETLMRGPVALSQVVRILGRALALVAGRHAAGQAHGAVGPDTVCFAQVGDALTVAVVDGPPGPPAYAPPEGHPSPVGDVHAFGVLAHHMITGRLPHPGPLPSLAGDSLQDVPEALDALIQAMSASDPARRPGSVEAVRAALENLELDSTLTGARLAEARDAVLGARQLYLTPPQGTAVDPMSDTFIRSRDDLEAELAEGEEDGFADTILRTPDALEAARGVEADAQATLLSLEPSRPAAPAWTPPRQPTPLDIETQLLMEPAVRQSNLRWVVMGVVGGLVVGGLIVVVVMLAS
ncbi:MAG: hypothetical protein H6730_09395 [Deltaproteobacteria bacterium]|nr:hypothetical protein [Deltaproteobacteria bacterium]